MGCKMSAAAMKDLPRKQNFWQPNTHIKCINSFTGNIVSDFTNLNIYQKNL